MFKQNVFKLLTRYASWRSVGLYWNMKLEEIESKIVTLDKGMISLVLDTNATREICQWHVGSSLSSTLRYYEKELVYLDFSDNGS